MLTCTQQAGTREQQQSLAAGLLTDIADDREEPQGLLGLCLRALPARGASCERCWWRSWDRGHRALSELPHMLPDGLWEPAVAAQQREWLGFSFIPFSSIFWVCGDRREHLQAWASQSGMRGEAPIKWCRPLAHGLALRQDVAGPDCRKAGRPELWGVAGSPGYCLRLVSASLWKMQA